MHPGRKTVLFIAMSLDGYIAGPNDDLGFLSMVEQAGEDYGYAEFDSSVDTVIMGRKTYEWVMKQVPEFPHSGKESFIVTRTSRPPIGKTQFYTGSLPALIKRLKSESGKNIFVDGGAEVVNVLLKEGLIDEFVISIIPILLGEGVRLFQDGRTEQKLMLIRSRIYEKGLVQLHYVNL